MPRNTLTVDQIVRAAIAQLDEEGLDGLNMRALGKRLNVAATAVYEAAGFAPADADRAAAAVFTYVLGNALAPAAVVALNRRLALGGEDAARSFAETKEHSVAIARTFPRLRERVDSPAASYAGT